MKHLYQVTDDKTFSQDRIIEALTKQQLDKYNNISAIIDPTPIAYQVIATLKNAEIQIDVNRVHQIVTKTLCDHYIDELFFRI